MNATKLAAFAATTAVAASALVPAVGMAKATAPGTYTVTKAGLRLQAAREDLRRHRLQGQHREGRAPLADWIDASVLTKKQ